MFNRKHDQKDTVPFQLRRPEDAVSAHQPPRIPSQDLASASVIGSDLSIEGQAITIRCQGLLTVNGDITADVHSKQLDVGREGSVVGSVSAENVEVHGKVQGAIHGARVVLHPTADVEGDIHTQFLTIQEGASFDGSTQPQQVTYQHAQPASSAPAASQEAQSQFGVGAGSLRPLS
jgi:cytoskeletal protein CcmA (bactofilin family)